MLHTIKRGSVQLLVIIIKKKQKKKQLAYDKEWAIGNF